MKPLRGVNAGGAGMGVCEWRIMGMCRECAAAAHSAKVVTRRVGHAILIRGLTAQLDLGGRSKKNATQWARNKHAPLALPRATAKSVGS